MHESSDSCEVGLVDQAQRLQRVCASSLCAHWEEAVVIQINITMRCWDVHDGHIEDADQQVEGGHQIREGRKQLRLGSDKQQPGRIKRARLVSCTLTCNGQVKVAAKEVLHQHKCHTHRCHGNVVWCECIGQQQNLVLFSDKRMK